MQPPSLERTSFERQPDYMKTSSRDRLLSAARPAGNAFLDSLDPIHAPRFFHDSGDIDFQDNMGLQSMEFSDSLEFSSASSDNHPAIAGVSSRSTAAGH